MPSQQDLSAQKTVESMTCFRSFQSLIHDDDFGKQNQRVMRPEGKQDLIAFPTLVRARFHERKIYKPKTRVLVDPRLRSYCYWPQNQGRSQAESYNPASSGRITRFGLLTEIIIMDSRLEASENKSSILRFSGRDNLAGWAWAFIAFRDNPVLLGQL